MFNLRRFELNIYNVIGGKLNILGSAWEDESYQNNQIKNHIECIYYLRSKKSMQEKMNLKVDDIIYTPHIHTHCEQFFS